jgi:hypothetical protein
MIETLRYGYGEDHVKTVKLEFERFDNITKGDIKRLAGVYMAYNSNDKVIYVGESRNVWQRVPNHFQQARGKFWKEISYVMVAYIDLDRYERHIIEGILVSKYQPQFNFSDEMINTKPMGKHADKIEDIVYYIKHLNYPYGRVAKALKMGADTVKKYADLPIDLPKDYKPKYYVKPSKETKQYTKITQGVFNEIRKFLENNPQMTNKDVAEKFNTYGSRIGEIKRLEYPAFKMWEEARLKATV